MPLLLQRVWCKDVGCWREGGSCRPHQASPHLVFIPNAPISSTNSQGKGTGMLGSEEMWLGTPAGGAEPEGTAATVVTPLPADRPSFSRGAHWRLARGAGAHWRLFCGQAGGCLMQSWPISAVAGGRRDPGRPRAGGAVQNALARTELHFSVYGPSTGPFEKLDVLHSTVDVLHSTVIF